MDVSLSGVSMEKAASLKVEEMVNLFERMDGKPSREVHQISMDRIGSPAKTEDSRALVSIPQSTDKLQKDSDKLQRDIDKVQRDSEREGSPYNTSMSGSSLNKDVEMAKIKKEKILSLIEAWEESKKKRSLYRYNKTMAKLDAWEVGKIARAQASLRTFEERLENKRATCVEKTSNKIAVVQKIAEEKRALAEACHGHEVLKVEETAAKCRASGLRPGSSFLTWR